MLHFAAPTTPAKPASTTVAAPAVVETVTVTPLPSQSRSHLLKARAQWGWQEVRDYVVTEIEARFGAFPRDAKKEYGIFSRFAKQYGERAGDIAAYAFETCDGWWLNAPVSVTRFCKGSDPYFGDRILQRLSEA